MIIDIIYLVLMLFAIIKGYQRGLIIGIFSLLAIVIGLAAAMKLSTVAADYIGDTANISGKWLPIVSFLLVFIIVVLLVRLGANAIEKTVEIVMLGWLNKLFGILLYAIIYTLVFSVLLFYAGQINFLKEDTIADSTTYKWIEPWGPRAINAFGRIIPFFRDMFEDLQSFFESIAASTDDGKEESYNTIVP